MARAMRGTGGWSAAVSDDSIVAAIRLLAETTGDDVIVSVTEPETLPYVVNGDVNADGVGGAGKFQCG